MRSMNVAIVPDARRQSCQILDDVCGANTV